MSKIKFFEHEGKKYNLNMIETYEVEGVEYRITMLNREELFINTGNLDLSKHIKIINSYI